MSSKPEPDFYDKTSKLIMEASKKLEALNNPKPEPKRHVFTGEISFLNDLAFTQLKALEEEIELVINEARRTAIKEVLWHFVKIKKKYKGTEIEDETYSVGYTYEEAENEIKKLIRKELSSK